MQKFYSLWRQFVRDEELKEARNNKRSQIQENLETLNEISREASDKIYKWMRDASAMDYSFNELFDGKMRMAMPFDSEDALNLKKAVRALKKDGWVAGELVPWEGGMHSSNKFPTRKVKQKRQRLADEGGGFYEEEIEVADLGLAKSYEKEIPAGPRKGEVIQRTDKLGMGKAIAKLVKEKKLDKELLDWWHKKQTYYTKDNNWNEIEGLFSGDEVDYTVIISRHPVDVLRMSDVGSIRSCHSEGRSHFQCAVAEAKGHGPIAYLVPTSMYEMLMSGLYEEYDTADDPEAAYDVDRSTSKLLKAHAAYQAEEYIKNHITTMQPRWSSIYKIIDNIKTSEDEDMLEFAIQAIFDADPVYGGLDPAVRGLLTDQAVMDAGVAKAEGKEWSLMPKKKEGDREERAREIGDISEFDDKEIFRDKQRGIKGIVAKGRVRFRKFEDSDTDMQFIAPEHRTYGAVPPGFVKSMVKWAAESQEQTFRDNGFLGRHPEQGGLHAPNWYSLTRYGGSYEDTQDGTTLDALFRQYDPKFKSYSLYQNVERHDEDEQESLFDEYEQRVDELNNYAANSLEYCSTHAEVNDDGEEPYVYASGDLSIELNLLGWNGIMEDYGNSYTSRGADEDGNPYIIPKSWGGDYQKRRQFESVIEANLDIYSEETDWEVNVQKGGAIGEKGPTTVLQVRFRWSMEDGYTPDDYENFIDYIKDDIDQKVPNIREAIRLSLVEEGHIERNYFDKLNYPTGWDEEHSEPLPTPAEELADRLQHFNFYPPSDDGDGEMLFVTKSPGVGQSSINYIPTSTLMPASLRKHDRATGWTVADLETAFGGTRFSLGFGTPPSVKHTGLGMHKIAMALSDIQKEAEAYAGKQLSLDFGERYQAPPDQDVLPDFAKNVEFITVLATPTASEQAGLPEADDEDSRYLGFGIRVRILSVDSEREIKGAIAFMEYVDKEIKTIAKAFQSLWGPAIKEAIENKEKAEAAAVSRGTADQFLNALDTYAMRFDDVPEDDPRFNPRAAGAKALILWTNESWDEMNKLERRVLINQYLRPLQQGSLTSVPPEHSSVGTPRHWSGYIQQAMREAGAPGAVFRQYKWEGPNYSKLYNALTDAEGSAERMLDADIEQAERVEQELSPMSPVADAEINAETAEEPANRDYDAALARALTIDPPNSRRQLEEAIRNVIYESIYKERPAQTMKGNKLRNSIRHAIVESLYGRGGPEDLPSMGAGLPHRDDDDPEHEHDFGIDDTDDNDDLTDAEYERLERGEGGFEEDSDLADAMAAARWLEENPGGSLDDYSAETNLRLEMEAREMYSNDPEDYSPLTSPASIVTSPQGNRFHPVHQQERFHAGTDIAFPRWLTRDNMLSDPERFAWELHHLQQQGIDVHTANDSDIMLAATEAASQIRSPANAQVVSIREAPGHGPQVVLRWWDNRTQSWYYGSSSHMGSVVNYEIGQRLPAGALLGTIGNEGTSTGPHLHWQFWQDSGGDGITMYHDALGNLTEIDPDGLYTSNINWEDFWNENAEATDPENLINSNYWLRNIANPEAGPALSDAVGMVPRSELYQYNSSALRETIRAVLHEALKIKVTIGEECPECGSVAPCVHNTRGETVACELPAEEVCELPTLEEAYIQNVYEAICGINIHKRKGGNRDQTLTDIRGIPGVTIVSVVPGTTRDLPHTFITNLSIKFQLNRNLPPRNYVQKELLPGMQSIPGISNFTIKRLQQISSVEDPE